jgi:hypothetical protein
MTKTVARWRDIREHPDLGSIETPQRSYENGSTQ